MYPEELRYTADHEWVSRQAPTVLRFGITAYAADALGDVVFVQLPDVGSSVQSGQPCGEVESTKSVSDIFAPVSGAVLAVNTALEDAPELVNSSPYEDGWMVDVECGSEQAADDAWAALMGSDQYAAGLS